MPTANIIRKQTARKDAIVASAMRLIRTRGLEAASLSNIADAAGISKGTLHYYYASKTDLFFDIAQKHVDDITVRMFRIIEDRAEKADPVEILSSLLDTTANPISVSNCTWTFCKRPATATRHCSCA
jgi:AcrR family transcriptional regulator